MESEGLTKTERAVTFVLGLCLAAAAAVCNIVSFSLDYWLFTPPLESQVGLQREGLWSVCVQSLVDERSRKAIQGVFYGCHWIFDSYFDKIRWTILNPPWFSAVQIMAVISLVLVLIGVISLLTVLRHLERFGSLVFGTLAVASSGLFASLEALIFGVYAKDSEFYLITNIQTKQLGPAWYLCLISAFFSVVAAMTLVVNVVSVRRKRRQRKRDLATKQLASGQHAAAARPALRTAR